MMIDKCMHMRKIRTPDNIGKQLQCLRHEGHVHALQQRYGQL